MGKSKIVTGSILFALIFLQAPICSAVFKKATLILQWVPQAQFSGYYVARELGLYKKFGIDLTIISGGPDRPPSEFLRDHKADFASLWLSSGLQMRSDGIKAVNIAQIVQRSALMLVAKKSGGIRTLRDIDGKKVGLWGPVFQIQPKALFKKFDLKVTVIPQSFTLNLFLRDGVQLASAMWYNEYHTLLSSGLNPDELVTFFFHEYGLNFPEDGIYTLEDTLEKDADLCKAFVEASLEGWSYGFAHPEKALDIIMNILKKEHVPASRIHQKWMLDRMKDLILPEDERAPTGRLFPKDFFRVASELNKSQLISEIPDFNAFHKNLRMNEK